MKAADVVAPAVVARRKSRHTREEMLTQAARLFAERGYRVTTLGDLATQIGIAKATLFHHFRTKEDILFELYSQVMDLSLERMREVDDSTDDPAEVLRRMFKEHALLILRNRALFTIAFAEESELTEQHAAQVRRQQSEYIELIAARVTQLIDAGRVDRAVHPRIVVQIGLGAGSWTQTWVQPNRSQSGAEISSTIADVILDGLLAKK